MKLVLLKNNLKSGLDTAGRAIGSNLNLPVLGSVLIRAEGSQIQVSATNLELAIVKNVFGKVIEGGAAVVPFNTISNIVNNIASERIHLEKTKQGNLELKTDNYTATIQGIDEKEFPIIPKIEKKSGEVQVGTQVFKDSLARVVIAVEVTDLRPEISGVLFKGEASSLRLAATDSFRLAEAKILGNQVKMKDRKPFEVTVPIKTSEELVRVIDDEETVSFYIENNQILFETESTALISRLVEGSFPDYDPIVPKEIDTKISIKKEELINALKLASSFASKSNDVRVKTNDKKVIEIYSSDNAVGENRYLIPAKIDGPAVESIFNWKYLLDGVRATVGKEIMLGLNGSDKPALIKDPGDDSYFYILMPIKPS